MAESIAETVQNLNGCHALVKGERNFSGQQTTNCSLYNANENYQKTIEYREKHLPIAREVGDRAVEGKSYCNLGNAYDSLGNFQKAIEYHEKDLSIAREVGDRAGEGKSYGNLGNAYHSLGNFQKAIEYYEKDLSIAREVGDRAGEGTSYCNLGNAYRSLGNLQKALKCYQLSVEMRNTIRASIKSEEALKISFRHLHSSAYNGLWTTLLELGRIEDALSAAEEGRAQALLDALTRYGLAESSSISLDTKETISYISHKLPTTVFLAHQQNLISFWVISEGSKVEFRQNAVQSRHVDEDSIAVLLKTLFENIRVRGKVFCENRALDVDHDDGDDDVDDKGDNEHEQHGGSKDRDGGDDGERNCDRDGDGHNGADDGACTNLLQLLHDAIIGPIADLCQSETLIIVPDGQLCLAPFSALSESMHIRTVPSLTTLRLITDSSEDCNNVNGALLVGDPYLGEVRKVRKPRYEQLPSAKKEVEMIGDILKIPPITGKDATKGTVLKRMSSVALIHIAAHGRKETGEIALAPNPGWEKDDHGKPRSSPREEDYILKMSDVQDAKIRARLVVLSCCHSGRGEINSEGVVGIARAFLVAGARSVVVSLWAISDMATMEFMKRFYQHLAVGKSTGVALHQAIKSLRESENFSHPKYWAPFVLIGDDVTLELSRNKSEVADQ